MSLGSLLAASEPLLSPGDEAVVCVAVATLWTSPERTRPVDVAALDVPARPRTWIEEMSDAERADLPGRTLTQLLLGEKALVQEARGDWVRVIALEQPSALDQRGFPGWLPIYQLAATQGLHVAGVRVAARHRESLTAHDRSGVWHVVEATATALRDDPDGALMMPGVTFGTRLLAAGAAHDGWLPVSVPGRFEPAWAIEDDVAAVPPSPPDDHQAVLEMAARLGDAPYIWGGTSAYGVDAPGLVYLTWRRFGVILPRDAADQYATTTPLALGQERTGDLYFFGPSGHSPDHVGFVAADPSTGSRQVLHASPVAGRVVIEEVTGDLAETLVGARRVTAVAGPPPPDQTFSGRQLQGPPT
jgi:gamma-D-glutamyl-L-lysine dipeptidyl-peptidase